MPRLIPATRRFVLIAALGLAPAGFAAEPAPAATAGDGWYGVLAVGSVGGFDVKTTSPGLSPARVSTQPGYEVAGGVGRGFGRLRIEGKVLHGRFDADQISFDGGGGRLAGYYDTLGATVEAFYDLWTGNRLRPYVGAGVGAVRFRARSVALDGFPPTVGDNTELSYQLLAGIDYAGPGWRIGLGYRYLGIGSQDFSTGGIPLRARALGTDAIQVSARLAF